MFQTFCVVFALLFEHRALCEHCGGSLLYFRSHSLNDWALSSTSSTRMDAPKRINSHAYLCAVEQYSWSVECTNQRGSAVLAIGVYMKGSNAKHDKRQIYTCAFFCGKILFTPACTSWRNFTSQNEINCSQNSFQSLGFYTKLHKRHTLRSLSWKFDKMDISGFALKPFTSWLPWRVRSRIKWS